MISFVLEIRSRLRMGDAKTLLNFLRQISLRIRQHGNTIHELPTLQKTIWRACQLLWYTFNKYYNVMLTYENELLMHFVVNLSIS